MTGLRQEALRRVDSLSRDEQDAIRLCSDPWPKRRWKSTGVVRRAPWTN